MSGSQTQLTDDDKSCLSPSTPGYVSADEEFFSDAAENMKANNSDVAPSTTVNKAPADDNEEELQTPIDRTSIAPQVRITLDSRSPEGNDVPQLTQSTDEPTDLESDSIAIESFRDVQTTAPSDLNSSGGDLGGQENAVPSIDISDTSTILHSLGSVPIRASEHLDVGQISFIESLPSDLSTGATIGENANFNNVGEGKEQEDNDFGDDFDDFGEAVDGDDGFDDFEAFEEGTTENGFEPTPQTVEPPVPPTPAMPLLSVPIVDFDVLEDEKQGRDTILEIVKKLYPSEEEVKKPPKKVRCGAFLTERSESLWNQLVAPPPLQPPDWKRSRIRRLFLVSLGVPVDLDEILPASKQKKLVLPSTRTRSSHLASSESAPSSRRNSSESSSRVRKSSRSKSRSRADTTLVSTASSGSGHRSSSKVDKIGPMPEFDESAARILCSTSDVVLQNMGEAELREHMRRLNSLTSTASELLTYWLKKRDGAMSDKETFETVIESLVGYARKTRQSGR